MAGSGRGDRPDEGAWIFVSHSHRDLHEVRRVRDALEAKGHQPLLFFLKCVSDDDELEELLRREIAARQFFVLCDSPNARASRYVQDEVALIKGLPDKVRVELALDDDWQAQLEAVDALSRLATVFISYAYRGVKSRRLATALAAALRMRDYRVFLDVDSVEALGNWAEQTRVALDSAIDHGFVLIVLEPAAVASSAVADEVGRALESERRGGVIPIIADNMPATLGMLPTSALEPLTDLAMLDFTGGSFDDNFAELLRALTR
jgi:TIR domain